MVCVPAVASAAQVEFAEQLRFATGSVPVHISPGDLDGDGHLDLIVTNLQSFGSTSPSDISVLLGNGDGLFPVHDRYDVGLQPRSTAIADISGDGVLDIAVANFGHGFQDSTIQFFSGSGNGQFTAEPALTAGRSLRSIATADFNHDGRVDIVVTHVYEARASVFLQDQSGSFAPPIDVPTGQNPINVVVSDMDGDGHPDLAVTNNDYPAPGEVSIILGRGDGTFEPRKSHGVGIAPRSGAAGDLDGDGLIDFVVANLWADNLDRQTDSTLSVLMGTGSGALGAEVRYPGGLFPEALATGDFNADGIPDLCTGHEWSSTVSVMLGRGDGTFEPPVRFEAGYRPLAIGVGDFNGDGLPDIATANTGSDDVSILLNTTVVDRDEPVLDIKPGSCLNPLPVRARGLLPAVLLGVRGFEAREVDPQSITLAGVSPIELRIRDVGSPSDPAAGGGTRAPCPLGEADGTDDLILKFRSSEIVAALERRLGRPLMNRETLSLGLTGKILGSAGVTPFIAHDTVLVLDSAGRRDSPVRSRAGKNVRRGTRR